MEAKENPGYKLVFYFMYASYAQVYLFVCFFFAYVGIKY